ncbi:MAG: hypothetical protein ACO1N7_09390 [Sphingobacteriaceae bacterium]
MIVVVCAGTVYFYSGDRNPIIIYCALGVIALSTLPVFTVHYNYYSHDKGKRLIINSDKNEIEIIKRGESTRVSLNQIESLVLTKGTRGVNSIFTDDYFYYQINLKDKKVLYLTSLLLKKDDLPLKSNFLKLRSYPTIEYYEQ